MFYKKISKFNWVFIAILLLAFGLRVYRLPNNPPELFSDEITHVLSARSILETGRDINGRFMFFFYNKLKLGAPVYGYLSATSTYIFGNNTFAIRFPAAFAGTVTVLLIFLYSLKITQNQTVSLLTAFVASTTPWLIYFSRIGWEPSLIVPFLLTAILLFNSMLKFKKMSLIILIYSFFGIAVYTADASEFIFPLFLGLLIILNIRSVWKQKFKHLIGLSLFCLLLLPLIYVSTTESLKHERSLRISTFYEGVNQKTVNIFLRNYTSHFTPTFLFEKGDPNLRHGTGEDGVIYWSLLPFILIGVGKSLKKFKNKYFALLIIWLFLFPLGGSLTNDGYPHATRTLIGAPILLILTAVGLNEALKFKKYSKLIIAAFVTLTIFEFVNFFQSYFVTYPINSQPWWEYGQSQIFSKIRKVSSGTETLCLTNVDYWHEETLIKYYFGVDNKYNIIYDIADPQCFESDIVVVPADFQTPENYIRTDTVFNLEGRPIWIIYRSTNS